MIGLLRDMVLLVVVVVAQVTIFRHLDIWGMYPDAGLVLLVFWMARQSRTRTLLLAFALGFLMDLLLDLWGLHMFGYTLTAAIMHGFVPKAEDSYLGPYQIGSRLALAGLVFFATMAVLIRFTEAYTLARGFFALVIGNTVFTVLLGIAHHTLTGRRG